MLNLLSSFKSYNSFASKSHEMATAYNLGRESQETKIPHSKLQRSDRISYKIR
jgi:hypothetical protein